MNRFLSIAFLATIIAISLGSCSKEEARPATLKTEFSAVVDTLPIQAESAQFYIYNDSAAKKDIIKIRVTFAQGRKELNISVPSAKGTFVVGSTNTDSPIISYTTRTGKWTMANKKGSANGTFTVADANAHKFQGNFSFTLKADTLNTDADTADVVFRNGNIDLIK